MMRTPHDRIAAWLIANGYETGWVLSGDRIVVWENSEPQPEVPAELLDETDNETE